MVFRQDYKAGDKLFVDYAGATIPIHDPRGGLVHPAAILGANSPTSSKKARHIFSQEPLSPGQPLLRPI